MVEIMVTLPPGVGLHARPAAMFVQKATAASVPITVGRPGQPGVDAKSILAVMSLAAKAGEQVVLSADGDDAQAILTELKTLLETPEG